jgi:nucleotide-binding universal stress UspA family protein
MTRPSGDRPVLIAYDGSPHARAAVEEAGRLLGGSEALVATVWQSLRPAGGMAVLGLPADVAQTAIAKLDEAAEQEARTCAEEGAALARTAGLQAQARAVRARGSVWEAVLRTADEVDARAVAIGSGGRSAVASAVLGSVSYGVVQRSRRPVLLASAQPGGGGAP